MLPLLIFDLIFDFSPLIPPVEETSIPLWMAEARGHPAPRYSYTPRRKDVFWQGVAEKALGVLRWLFGVLLKLGLLLLEIPGVRPLLYVLGLVAAGLLVIKIVWWLT